MTSFDATFIYEGQKLRVHITPSLAKKEDDTPATYQVFIDRYYKGDIYCADTEWKIYSPHPVEQKLIDILGDLIFRYMQ